MLAAGGLAQTLQAIYDAQSKVLLYNTFARKWSKKTTNTGTHLQVVHLKQRLWKRRPPGGGGEWRRGWVEGGRMENWKGVERWKEGVEGGLVCTCREPLGIIDLLLTAGTDLRLRTVRRHPLEESGRVEEEEEGGGGGKGWSPGGGGRSG